MDPHLGIVDHMEAFAAVDAAAAAAAVDVLQPDYAVVAVVLQRVHIGIAVVHTVNVAAQPEHHTEIGAVRSELHTEIEAVRSGHHSAIGVVRQLNDIDYPDRGVLSEVDTVQAAPDLYIPVRH